ncbi:hypothetical protein JOF48_002263 [Arthrobacter stackebrandtii]|uniref:Cardiolipin synthase N-terminal domain-containing protein n=1 Tax=Arthrobacter stackebrandtii TaxID=272161 RepID=A0ABS4YXL0_9MICC|nr:PLDc N-terminal domain-containing protein [Arthrobacter stackebrandtii]MBP2413464.1 hypothetical protein [Arthrobacter stackebrandtii]PYH00688.1 hypothetical protein CVV67_09240 [Arthrobacter stackebrandtii]
MARKRWSELGKGRRAAMVAAGIVQIALQLAALRDISRRTPAQVNGSKAGWVAASFINFAGPIAWFLRGRKN